MTIEQAYKTLRAEVDKTAHEVGRDAHSVRIIAVSKKQPVSAIREAYAAGVRDFGENYAQEWRDKAAVLADLDARWHFIGSLQRNKVKYVVGRVARIHSVDSAELASAISARAQALNLVQECLLEVNCAGEASKAGISPEELPELIAQAKTLPNIQWVGLMTMPPLSANADESRGYFRALRELRDRNATADVPLAELSMGTSHDFRLAIAEGATCIRVGTTLFGARS